MGKTSHRSTATLERIDAARIHRERTIWADFTAPDGGDANAGFALRLGEVIPAQKKKARTQAQHVQGPSLRQSLDLP